jgi:putative molybdopterin biosynthesis protein
MPKEFRSLISLEEARSIVLRHLPLAEARTVPLSDALGKILAEKVVSSVDVPGFNRASMDGFAIRAADVLAAREDHPMALNLVGRVPMGLSAEIAVGPGQAAEVSTGSMMPPGADAVAMIEHTSQQGDAVLVYRPLYPGENVTGLGSDITLGETVLYPGTPLFPRELGVLAAVGRREATVRDLRVGVASTGDELAEPGLALRPGQVYDINSYSIAASVKVCGGSPVCYGILPDEKEAMSQTLAKMAEECAMIIISGSTSAGAGDMVFLVMEELGELLFHGINLKPGKPTLFGIINGKPCLGLPGYPTSALTVFAELAAPAIEKALGARERSRRIKGKLAQSVRGEGRRQMLAVSVAGDMIFPVDKGSGSITTLSRADGVIEIPPEKEYLEKGEEVEVRLFGELEPPDLIIAGESCPFLELVAESLPYQIKLLTMSSQQALLSLQDGMVDAACVSPQHDLIEGISAVFGYSGELGLMAADPALLDPEKVGGASLAGWPSASWMGQEMNRCFQDLGLDPAELALKRQARTHSAVAASVSYGETQVGFGAKAAAEAAGLFFRGLIWERIDLLARERKLKSEPLRALISALQQEIKRGGTSLGISLSSTSAEPTENCGKDIS